MSPSLPSGSLARASFASMPKRTYRATPRPDTSLGTAAAETTLSTRSGCRRAMRWAMMPPSEAPKMCAWPQPSASRTAIASSVMSSDV